MCVVGFVIPVAAGKIVWKIHIWRPLIKKGSRFSSANYIVLEYKGCLCRAQHSQGWT